MARGNNSIIPSGTAILQKTLTGDLRNSILVLNPNDGVLYVVINGGASPVTWDFVVPSQSYAALPGPFESYGLYYVDQSGAGRSGNVTVYESDDQLQVPIYQAVGIARLAQATSMDVVEGAQPANPGAGIARLWVDTNNFLHILEPTGTDATEIDTRSALGGALSGFLPNPTIPDGSIFGTKLANGAITDNQIATNTITADRMVSDAISTIGAIQVGGITTTSTTPVQITGNTGDSTWNLYLPDKLLVFGYFQLYSTGGGAATINGGIGIGGVGNYIGLNRTITSRTIYPFAFRWVTGTFNGTYNFTPIIAATSGVSVTVEAGGIWFLRLHA